MLDINFIRENAALVKSNMTKKNQDNKLPLVDELIEKDEQNRKLIGEAQELRAKRNKLSEDINKQKKDGKDASDLLKEAALIPKKLEEIELKQSDIQKRVKEIQLMIPNIMNSAVPIGKSDADNVELKKIGKEKNFDFEVKSHVEIAEALNIADFESSARVAGNGFYYLEGELALLNQALIRFGVDTMVRRGFRYVETPLMLKEEIIDQVTDLNDKSQQIYLLRDEDSALIGTSEHSLIGRYAKQTIDKKNLPIKQTSYSMCFRKEIGSHGIDEKGLYRTHQFNKIEMIVICEPQDSMKYYEELQSITVEIFEKMGIPIRILGICSGDLGDLKHIQVDIEAYSPRRKQYFEVGSCSNLTESQARKLNIKATDGSKRYVPHTLNNTAIATSRALVAILENYQNKDGSVDIPQVLWPYMNGIKRIEKAK